jgi:hypothetical protein
VIKGTCPCGFDYYKLAGNDLRKVMPEYDLLEKTFKVDYAANTSQMKL